MAVYLINENRKLREDFSASFPDWLLKNLKGNGFNNIKRALNKGGVDLSRATFIETDPPTSNRDPMLKDPDKIPIFLLNDGTIYSPKFPSTGEQYAWYIDSYGRRQGDYIKNLSWRKVLDATDKFGYIDATDASNFNKELRQQRSTAKAGMVDRYGQGQYRSPIYGKKQTDWGERTDYDNIVGYKWLTKSGYDKSGYPLDPEKYVRKLNQVGLDNYSEKLERYYDMITKAQQDAAKWITDFDPNDLEGRRDFRDITGYLDRAIYYYKELVKSINGGLKRIENGNSTRESVEASLRGWVSSYGKDIYNYLKEFNKELRGER